jgi:hypothetical protein
VLLPPRPAAIIQGQVHQVRMPLRRLLAALQRKAMQQIPLLQAAEIQEADIKSSKREVRIPSRSLA